MSATRDAAELRRAGRPADAEALLRKHLRRSADDWEAHRLLAMCLLDQRRAEQAAFHAERAASLAPAPARADALTTLGNALSLADRPRDAADAYSRAVALRPSHEHALLGLGAALARDRRFDDAEPVLRTLVAAHPGSLPARRSLAKVLQDSGRIAECIDVYRETLALAPDDAPTHSALCLAMHYAERADVAALAAAHRAFGAALGRWLATRGLRPAPPPRPPRAGPVTVAYVSTDLRDHSVACFAEALLRHHDPARVRPVGYLAHAAADHVTGRLRACAPVHAVDAATPDALARRIAADAPDILVELNGHTSFPVLAACALRPAPVIASMIAYPDTTGVPAITTRIVDARTDPPGTDDRCVERLARIDGCFLCYTPRPEAPEVGDPPSAAGAHVTFGSFNALPKVNPGVARLWARVLLAVPNARLLLKGRFYAEKPRRALLDVFAAAGVEPARVELLGHTPSTAEHLAAYNRVDVALDTFPYHGTTTTCEALWQGVPVVTLAGDAHMSRVGVSLLDAVGLGELAAPDEDAYVRLAAELATDTPRLTALRRGMRDRLRASPLLNGATYARRVEDALIAAADRG